MSRYYMRRLLPSQFRKGMHIEKAGTIHKITARACSKRGTHVEFEGGPTGCYSPYIPVIVRVTIPEEESNGSTQGRPKESGRKSQGNGGRVQKAKGSVQQRSRNGGGSKGRGRPRGNGTAGARRSES